MLNLILCGPPGSGKGTQAKKLTEKYHLIHISTGDLFRREKSTNSPIWQEVQRTSRKPRSRTGGGCHKANVDFTGKKYQTG